MSATFPASVKTFPTLNAGDTIQDTDPEAAYDEIVAIEQDLLNGLTHKLNLANNNAYFSEVDNGNSGTSKTIDWATKSNKQKITLTGNCTFTFTAPNGPCSILLVLIQDGTGSRTVTWPAAVKWPGGTAPTLSTGAAAVDIIAFYYNGTNYYGSSSVNFS